MKHRDPLSVLLSVAFALLIVGLLVSWPQAQTSGFSQAGNGSYIGTSLKLAEFAGPAEYRIYIARDVEAVRYTVKTKTLVVTNHAPIDLLICFRDEDHCDTPEGWRKR